MVILVAFEESQTVCAAFRARGHEAYSCDIQECSGGHPEWHIRGDVYPLLNGHCTVITMDGVSHKINGRWDMLIAHPPCTYLCVSGNRWYNVNRYGFMALYRQIQRSAAIDDFLRVYNADCDKIAIENPVGVMNSIIKPSQIIKPHQFGHPARKTTCLWLKGLPILRHTEIVEPEVYEYIDKKGRVRTQSRWMNHKKDGRAKHRSKTFSGIAEAMAEQWGSL